MADALPGLGIVAAVLGVVITMGALGGPKEEIGAPRGRGAGGHVPGNPAVLRHFRAARVGHGQAERSGGPLFRFLRMACAGFVKGLSPIMAVELARRSIPTGVRPTFQEMEGGLPRRR